MRRNLGHFSDDRRRSEKIREIAVVAEKLAKAAPCGGCRQRIAEFGAADTLIHLCDENGIVETVRLGELLPGSFKLEV